jgi:hypothetical protein
VLRANDEARCLVQVLGFRAEKGHDHSTGESYVACSRACRLLDDAT